MLSCPITTRNSIGSVMNMLRKCIDDISCKKELIKNIVSYQAAVNYIKVNKRLLPPEVTETDIDTIVPYILEDIDCNFYGVNKPKEICSKPDIYLKSCNNDSIETRVKNLEQCVGPNFYDTNRSSYLNAIIEANNLGIKLPSISSVPCTKEHADNFFLTDPYSFVTCDRLYGDARSYNDIMKKFMELSSLDKGVNKESYNKARDYLKERGIDTPKLTSVDCNIDYIYPDEYQCRNAKDISEECLGVLNKKFAPERKVEQSDINTFIYNCNPSHYDNKDRFKSLSNSTKKQIYDTYVQSKVELQNKVNKQCELGEWIENKCINGVKELTRNIYPDDKGCGQNKKYTTENCEPPLVPFKLLDVDGIVEQDIMMVSYDDYNFMGNSRKLKAGDIIVLMISINKMSLSIKSIQVEPGLQITIYVSDSEKISYNINRNITDFESWFFGFLMTNEKLRGFDYFNLKIQIDILQGPYIKQDKNIISYSDVNYRGNQNLVYKGESIYMFNGYTQYGVENPIFSCKIKSMYLTEPLQFKVDRFRYDYNSRKFQTTSLPYTIVLESFIEYNNVYNYISNYSFRDEQEYFVLTLIDSKIMTSVENLKVTNKRCLLTSFYNQNIQQCKDLNIDLCLNKDYYNSNVLECQKESLCKNNPETSINFREECKIKYNTDPAETMCKNNLNNYGIINKELCVKDFNINQLKPKCLTDEGLSLRDRCVKEENIDPLKNKCLTITDPNSIYKDQCLKEFNIDVIFNKCKLPIDETNNNKVNKENIIWSINNIKQCKEKGTSALDICKLTQYLGQRGQWEHDYGLDLTDYCANELKNECFTDSYYNKDPLFCSQVFNRIKTLEGGVINTPDPRCSFVEYLSDPEILKKCNPPAYDSCMYDYTKSNNLECKLVEKKYCLSKEYRDKFPDNCFYIGSESEKGYPNPCKENVSYLENNFEKCNSAGFNACKMSTNFRYYNPETCFYTGTKDYPHPCSENMSYLENNYEKCNSVGFDACKIDSIFNSKNKFTTCLKFNCDNDMNMLENNPMNCRNVGSNPCLAKNYSIANMSECKNELVARCEIDNDFKNQNIQGICGSCKDSSVKRSLFKQECSSQGYSPCKDMPYLFNNKEECYKDGIDVCDNIDSKTISSGFVDSTTFSNCKTKLIEKCKGSKDFYSANSALCYDLGVSSLYNIENQELLRITCNTVSSDLDKNACRDKGIEPCNDFDYLKRNSTECRNINSKYEACNLNEYLTFHQEECKTKINLCSNDTYLRENKQECINDIIKNCNNGIGYDFCNDVIVNPIIKKDICTKIITKYSDKDDLSPNAKLVFNSLNCGKADMEPGYSLTTTFDVCKNTPYLNPISQNIKNEFNCDGGSFTSVGKYPPETPKWNPELVFDIDCVVDGNIEYDCSLENDGKYYKKIIPNIIRKATGNGNKCPSEIKQECPPEDCMFISEESNCFSENNKWYKLKTKRIISNPKYGGKGCPLDVETKEECKCEDPGELGQDVMSTSCQPRIDDKGNYSYNSNGDKLGNVVEYKKIIKTPGTYCPTLNNSVLTTKECIIPTIKPLSLTSWPSSAMTMNDCFNKPKLATQPSSQSDCPSNSTFKKDAFIAYDFQNGNKPYKYSTCSYSIDDKPLCFSRQDGYFQYNPSPDRVLTFSNQDTMNNEIIDCAGRTPLDNVTSQADCPQNFTFVNDVFTGWSQETNKMGYLNSCIQFREDGKSIKCKTMKDYMSGKQAFTYMQKPLSTTQQDYTNIDILRQLAKNAIPPQMIHTQKLQFNNYNFLMNKLNIKI